jgi:zinc transporter 9
MRHITILGAGLLIGTALAVIIPEGIHALYSNEACHSSSSDHNVHKRDIFLSSPFSDSNSISQGILKIKRETRELNTDDDHNHKYDNHDSHLEHQKAAKEQLELKMKADKHEENGHGHSAIGITLVLGFVFMLIVDQIGGKMSHNHNHASMKNSVLF